MTGPQDKVLAGHAYDPKMPKSALVYHVREPHVHGPTIQGRNTRVEQVTETPQEIRKWDVHELRDTHRQLHGGPR